MRKATASIRNCARSPRKCKLNPGLKSFELKTMTCRSLKPGVKAEFELPDGEKARVIVKHAADAQNRVGLAIKPPCQGEIVYRTVCGKFLPIVTRLQDLGGQAADSRCPCSALLGRLTAVKRAALLVSVPSTLLLRHVQHAILQAEARDCCP